MSEWVCVCVCVWVCECVCVREREREREGGEFKGEKRGKNKQKTSAYGVRCIVPVHISVLL